MKHFRPFFLFLLGSLLACTSCSDNRDPAAEASLEKEAKESILAVTWVERVGTLFTVRETPQVSISITPRSGTPGTCETLMPQLERIAAEVIAKTNLDGKLYLLLRDDRTTGRPECYNEFWGKSFKEVVEAYTDR